MAITRALAVLSWSGYAWRCIKPTKQSMWTGTSHQPCSRGALGPCKEQPETPLTAGQPDAAAAAAAAEAAAAPPPAALAAAAAAAAEALHGRCSKSFGRVICRHFSCPHARHSAQHPVSSRHQPHAACGAPGPAARHAGPTNAAPGTTTQSAHQQQRLRSREGSSGQSSQQ